MATVYTIQKQCRQKKFERPSDAYVSTIKISFQLKLPFRSWGEGGGGVTQREGQKHLVRASVLII